MSELTAKQQAFIDLHIINLNAPVKKSQTQIAIDAGYAIKAAAQQASRMLNNANIQKAIQSRFSETAMSSNEVLHHLSDIARGAVKDVDINQRLKALSELAKYHNLTNTTQIKTWKDDAIDAIKSGRIEYDDLRQVAVELGESETLADELFRLAGVPITS